MNNRYGPQIQHAKKPVTSLGRERAFAARRWPGSAERSALSPHFSRTLDTTGLRILCTVSNWRAVQLQTLTHHSRSVSTHIGLDFESWQIGHQPPAAFDAQAVLWRTTELSSRLVVRQSAVELLRIGVLREPRSPTRDAALVGKFSSAIRLNG